VVLIPGTYSAKSVPLSLGQKGVKPLPTLLVCQEVNRSGRGCGKAFSYYICVQAELRCAGYKKDAIAGASMRFVKVERYDSQWSSLSSPLLKYMQHPAHKSCSKKVVISAD
jgi:hypothetical protein